jgi:hypothetical protein
MTNEIIRVSDTHCEVTVDGTRQLRPYHIEPNSGLSGNVVPEPEAGEMLVLTLTGAFIVTTGVGA